MNLRKRILLVTIILSLVFSNINVFAVTDTLTMPAALRIIGERAYYGDTSISRVVLPDGIKEIRARAFANSSLSEINLPASLTYIDDTAFDGPDKVTVIAAEGTYAYYWAVENGYIIEEEPLFSIDSISCSKNGVIPVGEKVFWSIQTSNSVGEVLYSYKVQKNGEIVKQQASSSYNYYSFIPQEPGEYTLIVTCQDENGNLVSRESKAIEVDNIALRINSLAIDKDDIVLGDIISITVIADGGYGAKEYTYDVWLNGESVEVKSTTESTYKYTINETGRYQFFVTVSDEQENGVVGTTGVYDVYSEAEKALPAPELVFDLNELPFGTTEFEAPLYYPERIILTWNHVEYAEYYAITMEQKIGSSWSDCFSDTTDECRYILTEDLFNLIEAETIFRVGVSSVGVDIGSVRYYYFKIAPRTTDNIITVDGKALTLWNQASRSSSVRVFSIESNLPWTAVTEADWVALYADENRLSISITENDFALREREADIFVSNGFQDCAITVKQGTEDSALTIEDPILSKNPNQPTIISAGQQYFAVSGNKKAILVVYEKRGNNFERVFVSDYASKIFVGAGNSSFRFKDNTNYRLDLMNVYDEQYETNELIDDIFVETYYVLAKDAASYVLVDGNTHAEVLMEGDDVSFYVNSSGLVSFSSDVDWISIPALNYRNQNYKRSISATGLNMTEADRIGHLYLECGTAEAVVTITQKSVAPRITFPAGLSVDESNPTSMPYGYIRYTGIFEDSLWFEKVNGTYQAVKNSHCSSSAPVEMTSYMTQDELTAGATYKIVVKTGDVEKDYYIKIGTSVLSNSVLLNGSEDPIDWTIDSGAYSSTVTIKGSNRWTASSSASWLTCSIASGTTTQKTATIKATANTTGAERIAFIVFKGGSSSTKYDVNYIKVVQAADAASTDEFLTVAFDDSVGYHLIQPEDTANLNSSKTSVSMVIMSNAVTSVSTNNNWITPSSTSVESGKKLKITLSQNTTGSVRSGSITLACGSKSKTIAVSQVPAIDTPDLVSPTLSTDYTNPTVFDCSSGDLVLTWNRIPGALYYSVYVEPDGSAWHSARIDGGNSATYSFACPQNWFDIDSGKRHDIGIHAYDQYGYSSYEYWSIYPQSGEGIYLNGELEPVWDNATDYAVSASYTVMSTGNWSAQSKASWITLNKSGGSNGEMLSVSLAQNNGSARTGKVAVTCGSHTSYLTVNQCAAIPLFPSLSYPELSDDRDNPSILPSDTDTITVQWNVEPQADEYYLTLNEFERNNVYKVIKRVSGKALKNNDQYTGNYTFTDLDLEIGQLYVIELHRSNNGRWSAHNYYILLDSGSSYVTFNGGKTEDNDVLEGNGDGHFFKVESSGYWTATSSASWLTIGKRYIDEDYLAEEDETAEENMVYRGNPGDSLYYFALPNTTGSSRMATITLRSGSSMAVYTVKQEKQYTTAILTSPTLGECPSETVDMGYGSIIMNWEPSIGGTGKYEVIVYESDSKNSRGDRVYRKAGLTSCSHTIPESTFSGEKFYRIWLGSEIESGDDYENGHYYYFYMNQQNTLEPFMEVDWQYAVVGGRVDVQASAIGGTWTYKYAYSLLCDDETVGATPWMSDSAYSFTINKAGSYQVRVYVQDSSGFQKDILSDIFAVNTVSESEIPLVTPSPEDEDESEEDLVHKYITPYQSVYAQYFGGIVTPKSQAELTLQEMKNFVITFDRDDRTIHYLIAIYWQGEVVYTKKYNNINRFGPYEVQPIGFEEFKDPEGNSILARKSNEPFVTFTIQISCITASAVLPYAPCSFSVMMQSSNEIDIAFRQSSEIAQDALARASIDLACAAYNNDIAVSLLKTERFGFTSIDTTRNVKSGTDTVGFTVAHKTIVDERGSEHKLYVVVLRGTATPTEWISNFNIGLSGDAHGFVTAGADVGLYLNSLNIDKVNDKIWVIGHSRAAAVTNWLCGVWAYKNGYKCENVYGYAFAVPNVVLSTTHSCSSIHNYRILNDPICYIPFHNNWGFTVYGQTGNNHNAASAELDRAINTDYFMLTIDAMYTLSNVSRENYYKGLYPIAKRIFQEIDKGTLTKTRAISIVNECLKNDTGGYAVAALNQINWSVPEFVDGLFDLIQNANAHDQKSYRYAVYHGYFN